MTSGVDPHMNDASIGVFCATCGHSEFVHSDHGNRRCVSAACDCNSLVAGAMPEASAQVFPA